MSRTAGSASGRVVRWNDERGFGFISPDSGGSDVFVHISEFAPSNRPVVGDRVTYTPALGSDGRRRAITVRHATVASPGRSRRRRRSAESGRRVATAIAIVLLLGVITWRVNGGASWALLALGYAIASLVAYLAYATDKSAATAGGWRVPESTLHLVGIVGGWPGAALAQEKLRHKTIKRSFQTTYWATVVANTVALALVPLPSWGDVAEAFSLFVG